MDFLTQTAIIDTETTGVDKSVDKILEIAGLTAVGDINRSELAQPGRDIPPEASAIHHITADDLIGVDTTPKDAVMAVLHTLGWPRYLVAHNAKFDRGFIDDLNIYDPTTGAKYNPTWICTYRCAVMTWPDAPNHKNQTLRYWLGYAQIPLLNNYPELGAHRALYDIICTRPILYELLEFNSLDRLVDWSNNPIILPKVTFGKHKGKDWSEVDYGYLRWCSQQQDMDEDVLHTVAYYMRRR